MARYFLEVAYKGTHYGGFQKQLNSNTIQSEIESALAVLHRRPFALTGSSRTDAGVHACQNFFHFDEMLPLHPQVVYKLNAILPYDIVVNGIYPVAEDAHSRFLAMWREYVYHIYDSKSPFLKETAFYYPYPLDITLLQAAADLLLQTTDFETFSKRNTQVFTYNCVLSESTWIKEDNILKYKVRGSRFLRGMVRALVGTMLKVGRGTISLEEFQAIIDSKDCSRADFSTPGHGLFLNRVAYPDGVVG